MTVELSNNNENKQAPLANDNSNDLLRFSLLPQLYDLGKTDLELQFILDLQSHQFRHDEVLLTRTMSDSLPTSLIQCLLHLEWPTFRHLRVSILFQDNDNGCTRSKNYAFRRKLIWRNNSTSSPQQFKKKN